MKLLFILASIYIIVEFTDYFTKCAFCLVMNTYKSHTAKVGALKKLVVTLLVVGLPTLNQLLQIVGGKYGFDVPDEISGFTSLFIVKQISSEALSIKENIEEFEKWES